MLNCLELSKVYYFSAINLKTMKTPEITTELQIAVDLLTSYWEEQRQNENANGYELAEAICTIAYVINKLNEEGEQ